ncbi:hypothetical protein F8O07_06595 [Pseudoclavibacter sp. CFCC 13796]|uniref:WXG100 family type VII secretion target n=1 Tax=unclassified Pseudoclavibacter TaxID=2615177 RepID=UPI0013016902|nr:MULTISPECIES: hypothetical protein [unclassified Pseudoclavibacter]KAB1661568.1 hypothetical protein F8O07_06595 [Pseudoclavibacter sp. CFCC 13796]MCD7100549.1 hypothetical protein [Pseudoclavibacter sp. 13-3]
MPDLQVDISALTGLAGQMRGTSNRLHGFGGGIDHGALGDGQVGAAAGEFDSHWGEVTEKIDTNIDSLSGMLSDSATSYQDTDQQIAASLTTQTSGGGM